MHSIPRHHLVVRQRGMRILVGALQVMLQITHQITLDVLDDNSLQKHGKYM